VSRLVVIDPKVKTSMWWDISLGKKTEIDYLNTAVVERGKQLKIKGSVLNLVNRSQGS
jgi:2-dehydropantoate 2-reductase